VNDALLQGLSRYGLSVVIVNVFINQLGIPVPVVPTLIVAGAVAAAGQLSFAWVFLGSALACVAADGVWYLIGRFFGLKVLRTLCRISLEPDSCVSQTQGRFERWGVNSLVIAKFVPGLAIVAPPLAGVLNIGWPRFLFLSTLAAFLWVGAWMVGGALFRTQIESLLEILKSYGGLAGGVIVGVLVVYIAYKWFERERFLRKLRMARISAKELHQLIKSGAAPVIVDVRSSTARSLDPRWIPNARHVPLGDVGGHIADLPRDKEIVLYCTCPSEASAARVAKLLINHGFTQVRPLFGGLDAWLAAGFPVEFDPPPKAGAAPAAPASSTV
jgi:membrane protein DedA with SNARE-associated domain/rhodanese-related sulfurtransferase